MQSVAQIKKVMPKIDSQAKTYDVILHKSSYKKIYTKTKRQMD